MTGADKVVCQAATLLLCMIPQLMRMANFGGGGGHRRHRRR